MWTSRRESRRALVYFRREPRGKHCHRQALRASVADADHDRRARRFERGPDRASRHYGLGMAEHARGWRPVRLSPCRRTECVVPRARERGGRRRRCVRQRILVSGTLSQVRAAWTSVVERPRAEHGTRPDDCERSPFPHGVGVVRDLRIFSDHARSSAPGGPRGRLAVSGGLTRRDCRAVRVLCVAGRPHRKLGTRTNA